MGKTPLAERVRPVLFTRKHLQVNGARLLIGHREREPHHTRSSLQLLCLRFLTYVNCIRYPILEKKKKYWRAFIEKRRIRARHDQPKMQNNEITDIVDAEVER